MEALDPAPENGADVELHPSPNGRDPHAVGVNRDLLIVEAHSAQPKTAQKDPWSPLLNGQESELGTPQPEVSEGTTATDDGAALEDWPQESDINGTVGHTGLQEEDGGDLLFQNRGLVGALTEDTVTSNHRPWETATEIILKQSNPPGDTDTEGVIKDSEDILTLHNHRPEDNALEQTVTQNHRSEDTSIERLLEGIKESLTLHDRIPEDSAFKDTLTQNHSSGQASLPHRPDDDNTEITSPSQGVMEEAGIVCKDNEQGSTETSLTLQTDETDEGGTESISVHSSPPTNNGFEIPHSHIPPESDTVCQLTYNNHKLQTDVTQDTLVPHQLEIANPATESSAHKDASLQGIHIPSCEDSTEDQKEPTLEAKMATEDSVCQALHQVKQQDVEEYSDKDFTDSASTDNTLEDSSEFTSSPLRDSMAQDSAIPSLIHKDEDVTADGWRGRRKHVFVLSEAGKPIYSRYGNEEALSSTMGVMMALVSFVQSSSNVIRSIYSGDHKVVFVQKGPLVLVSVSRTLQSEDQLRRELHYVYYQIISMLTQASIRRIFEHKKNYDLRRLLTGSEKILDSLLNLVETDASYLLGAVQCLPLASSVRDSLNAILLKAITPNLVFSILLANSQLVTIVQEKAVIEDCRLEPTDLLLLLNLIRASSAFQAGEIWTPICLPRFNPDGYFYAYISYLDPECTVCLILLSTDKESFYSVSDCKKRIDENLRTQNLLQVISAARQSHSYSASLVGVSDLRHFMYKPLDIPENYKQLTQFTSPEAEGPYSDEEERQRLFDLYRYLHSRIHSTSRPLKLIYHVAEKETLLAWVTSKFELYTSYSPLVTKAGAINVITKLLRWIKKEEDRLFIRYPPKYSTTPAPGKGSKSTRGGVDRTDASENGFFSGL
ncbi:vacuolar fusion protein MON1 homolog B-like [Pleurodeles waltl]